MNVLVCVLSANRQFNADYSASGRGSNADCSETFRRLVCEWQFKTDYSASGRGSVGGVSQINLRPIYVVDPMFLSQGGNVACSKSCLR